MIVDGWQRYRDTLDSLLEGFQIISADWTYLYVNPAAARHGRRTPEELQGRKMWEAYPGIEETPLFAALRRCMAEREPASLENLFTFADGSARWFEIRIEPVPEGLCVHSVDIQERKAAEARLREQESMAALGQMAAVVAHEMRNPLAGLSGALQVLRGRRKAPDPELAVFDEMLACIHSLDDLIRNLLIFGRPIEIRPAPAAIDAVARDALLVLEHDDCMKGHTVEIDIGSSLPPVRGDRELLKNVFRNLFLNAAQAMRDPGVIRVRAEAAGASCRVIVSDTGPGIPPSLGMRIFEPFVGTRKGGTGLGLAISRRIMRLHGGDLTAEATTGSGATFELTLPFWAER